MTDEKLNKGALAPTTVTETELESPDFAALTPGEEKVLRMAHGISESPSHELSFGLGASEETLLKLAMMEQNLLAAFTKSAPPTFDLDDSHLEAKARIIETLRNKD